MIKNVCPSQSWKTPHFPASFFFSFVLAVVCLFVCRVRKLLDTVLLKSFNSLTLVTSETAQTRAQVEFSLLLVFVPEKKAK